MIKVKIKSVLSMAKILGANEIYIDLPDGSSVADLVSTLKEKYGHDFQEAVDFEKHCKINRIDWKVRLLLNGNSVELSELKETTCSDGDTICLMVPLAGG
jgi:molybdopterin converting factor small subunit